MTGIFSALTSRYWQKDTLPPTVAANDNTTSDKAQAIAKKSILSIGYWFPSWDSTTLNQFANEQEACVAKILLSPFPQKFTSLNSLFTLLTQILQNSSRIDPEILEEANTLLQEFTPEILEKTFAEMFKDLDPARKQEILEAFQNLAPTLDKLASGVIPSGDKLKEDQKFISALDAISQNIDMHRSFYYEALDYLETVLQPYTDKNVEVLKAFTLINNKLEQEQYSFTFEETSVLAAAVSYLYAKERPQDPFFKALYSFLCLAPTTIRKEASRALFELNEELKLLPNDKKIIEKLERSSQGSYLPQQAEAYFYLLQTEGLFERLQNKKEQTQELEKVNNILFDFVESNADRPNRHSLSSVLDHAQNFLLNPEIVSNPSSQDSHEQPSAWNRMKSAVTTVFGGNQNPSAPKELSTIDKVSAITDKLLTLTTFIQKAIAGAHEILGKTAEKLANLRYHPTEDNIQETIKLLDRLLSNPKEIIKKDQWEAKQLSILTDLKTALSTAKNPLEPGVIKQLRDAEEILLQEMQDLNGDIPNLLHMFQTFFLNRDEGFLVQSFNQLNAEVSNFLKTQTAESERSLNLFKSFLLDPEHGLTSAFFNQVESRAEQLSGKLSNSAYPDLEDTSHALYRLKRGLEISSKKDLPKLARSVVENIYILKHQKDTLFSKEALDNNEISI
ncbi:MAG TPA: hypothetical protein VLE96_02080, partial [Chlamydiales bacterium]|nr:hypothetical protein [Chlamydiales bacterium]